MPNPDVAARGIDVAGTSHIIDLDLPKCAEDDVHPVGPAGKEDRLSCCLFCLEEFG